MRWLKVAWNIAIMQLVRLLVKCMFGDDKGYVLGSRPVLREPRGGEEMRLAVVGSRNWLIPMNIYNVLNEEYPAEVVTGGAGGVDSYAESWAKLHMVRYKIFLPDWNKYGKKAGALRNRQIVDYCDKLIAFWDGKSKGTKISIEMAQKAGKLMKVYLQ